LRWCFSDLHLLEAIDKNCMNISVLLERRAKFCRQLTGHPEIRSEELRNGKYCNGSYRCK
jgi:hypothetical protein